MNTSKIHGGMPVGLQPNLHVPTTLSGQSMTSQVTGKTFDSESMDLVAHIQDMLNQLLNRGINSMLVTVGPLGEIGIHGSHKGQTFLKENPDIADRFSKICSGLVSLAESIQPGDLQANCDNQTVTETNSFIIQHDKEVSTRCDSTSSNSNSEIDEPVSKPQDIETDSDNVLRRTDTSNESIYPDSAQHASTEPLCEQASVGHESPSLSSVCYCCGITFVSEDRYRDHFKVSQCPIVCPTCGTQLPDSNSLTVHNRLHIENIQDHFDTEFIDILHILDTGMDYFCQSCNESFDKKEHFVRHTIENHSAIFTCRYCKIKMSTLSSLPLHETCQPTTIDKNSTDDDQDLETRTVESTVNTDNNLRCDTCSVTFKNMFTLKRHQRSKHPVEWHNCETCDKKYPSSDALRAHQESHDLKFKCTFENCGKHCKSKRSLDLHLQTHVDKGPFICTVCQKSFPSQGKLNSHQQYHTTERSFKCDVCDKAFKTVDVFNRHVRTHNTSCHFYCEVCGKGFNQAGSLKRHKDTHDNIKRYSCDVCGTAFSQSLALQIHKLNAKHFKDSQEMADKTITCTYCDKLFIKEGNHLYENHLLTHTGQKPHQCDVCKKQFNDRSNLNAHKKIHTGTKPFRCSNCGKAYIHRSQLKKHMEYHEKHKDDPVSTATPKVKVLSNMTQPNKDIQYKADKTIINTQHKGKVNSPGSYNECPSQNQTGDYAIISQPNQGHMANPADATTVSQTFSVLAPMSSLLTMSNTPPNSVSIPFNIVYDTSSILQLASVSAGVVDVGSIFPQTSFDVQGVDSFPGQSIRETSGHWPDRPEGGDISKAPANDVNDTGEMGEGMDDDTEYQNSTWSQMNTMFNCKSPKDIDHAHDNWM